MNKTVAITLNWENTERQSNRVLGESMEMRASNKSTWRVKNPGRSGDRGHDMNAHANPDAAGKKSKQELTKLAPSCEELKR
ncbi:hypothetical protein R1flu_016887 [Riccia fluitans]|uniref:Uncharacterized protein n=1 Tax=Riccia fluitans TaxID=41844 RepID=A0ABD1YN50_9MARC